MSETRERRPVRQRRDRRPILPLVLLLVLAVVALGVWWNVVRDAAAADRQAAAACTSAAQAPPSLDPTTVQVRVLNATDKAGLAQTVAATLQSRGYDVVEVANDSSGRQVQGFGEVRHGPAGGDVARFVALSLPGATEYQDTRADTTVDLVIGPDYTELATADAVAAALAPAASPSAGC